MIAFRDKSLGRWIYLRSRSSDISVFEQVVLKREFDINLDRSPQLIIDGGANCGLVSVYLALKYPDARIIAVEPSRRNCELIRQNIAGLSNVEILCGALWSRNTHLKIENPGDEYWAYRCVEANPEDKDAFKGYDIGSILASHNAVACDLLKLDIEGAEVELFAKPEAWLENVSTIVVEIHGQRAASLIAKTCPAPDWTSERTGEKLLLKRSFGTD